MCTNFIDLKKYYPKDNFPLTRIDQIIDTAVRSETMELLDYFLGYHQIWLHEEDEENTSFITPFETYCYLRMCHTLVLKSKTEASIRVPRMFKSHT
jgi:hypothetical protein